MQIDIVFDTVCPWCFIGKRRLERALAMRPQLEPHLTWRPFLLNPELPSSGMDRETYLARKFGGDARVKRMQATLGSAGAAEGIPFAFDQIRRTPNSLMSHRLIRLASGYGRQAAAVEAVFQAYFLNGRDIGDIEVLIDLGESLGLNRFAVWSYLRSEIDIDYVLSENSRAHRMGITGVPCYILDGRYAISGAQEPEIFLRLFDLARENATEDIPLSST